MKKFFLGLALGVFLTVCIFFMPYTDPRLRIRIGRILDEDIIYLKNKSIVRGWIVRETPKEILVEVENGTFSLRLSECEGIRKNYLLKYVRELT
ncbi:MAG: hypothetical protein ABH843_02380 [Candidatus Omnitrophota bacterium]